MDVVYTIPTRPHPKLRATLWIFLALVCIASVVFTTIGFVRVLHGVKVHPASKEVRSHGKPNRTH